MLSFKTHLVTNTPWRAIKSDIYNVAEILTTEKEYLSTATQASYKPVEYLLKTWTKSNDKK